LADASTEKTETANNVVSEQIHVLEEELGSQPKRFPQSASADGGGAASKNDNP
jgi:hypothetical protein